MTVHINDANAADYTGYVNTVQFGKNDSARLSQASNRYRVSWLLDPELSAASPGDTNSPLLYTGIPSAQVNQAHG